MKISIAMATYNGARFIEEQLRSFVKQTRRPDELVISDDGSTDATGEIISQFATSAPFPVCCFQNTGSPGYTGNFSSAIERTTGDLVFLSDQDDVWLPSKLANVERLARTHPDKLLFINDAAMAHRDLRPTGLTKLGQIRSLGLGDETFVMGCCCGVRRQLLTFGMPIPEGFHGHDNWLVGLSNGLGATLIHEEVLQLYRRHDQNQSQFLANSLEPTKRHQLWLKIARTVLLSEPRHLQRSLQQMQSFQRGVQASMQRAEDPWRPRLEDLNDRVDADIAELVKRLAIRSHSFPARALQALSYWKAGGYGTRSGLLSALRDIRG
jgi:glycosyltransferase involved in cell wall biosynthesis